MGWLDRLYFYVLAKLYSGFYRLCDMIDQAAGFPAAGSDRDAVVEDNAEGDGEDVD